MSEHRNLTHVLLLQPRHLATGIDPMERVPDKDADEPGDEDEREDAVVLLLVVPRKHCIGVAIRVEDLRPIPEDAKPVLLPLEIICIQ